MHSSHQMLPDRRKLDKIYGHPLQLYCVLPMLFPLAWMTWTSFFSRSRVTYSDLKNTKCYFYSYRQKRYIVCEWRSEDQTYSYGSLDYKDRGCKYIFRNGNKVNNPKIRIGKGVRLHNKQKGRWWKNLLGVTIFSQFHSGVYCHRSVMKSVHVSADF